MTIRTPNGLSYLPAVENAKEIDGIPRSNVSAGVSIPGDSYPLTIISINPHGGLKRANSFDQEVSDKSGMVRF